MSFLRHAQIYRSDAIAKPGSAVSRCPGHHRLDESAVGYSLASCSPAEPASASPTIIHAQKSGGWRQPPPDEGWGIFTRRFGEFSSGLDTRLARASLTLRPANLLTHAYRGLGRKASTPPVTRRCRFSATQAYRCLLWRDLHPQVDLRDERAQRVLPKITSKPLPFCFVWGAGRARF